MNKSILVAAIVALALTACGQGYSDGARVGVVTKFSKKGLVAKSWEGTIVQGGFRAQQQGLTNEFHFSVVDDNVAAKVQRAMEQGKSVEIRYEQWLFHPYTQDTAYTVVGVREVAE